MTASNDNAIDPADDLAAARGILLAVLIGALCFWLPLLVALRAIWGLR